MLIGSHSKFCELAFTVNHRGRGWPHRTCKEMFETFRLVAIENLLSEEWSEDPSIVMIDSVVVEDGSILAFAGDSDEWPTGTAVAR